MTVTMWLGGMMFSYIFGFVPAVAAGAFVGLVQIGYGRVPWYVALVVGVIVGIAYAGVMESRSVVAGSTIHYAVVNLLTCIIPTMLCWALARKRYST
jgi:hypothetical protein